MAAADEFVYPIALAARWQVHPHTAVRWLKQGGVRLYRFGHGKRARIRIKWVDVIAFEIRRSSEGVSMVVTTQAP